MTLSIIIPTHKRVHQASRLLQSIVEQNFPYEDLQVLLISNLKDKKWRSQVAHWESVFFDFKYKEMGKLGVNKARNMGIRFAGGDILYFLDDDCLLPNKNHLQSLIEEHKKNPEVMGIGGAYKAIKTLHGLKKFYHEQSKQWIDSMALKSGATQLIGGNASYKREVFDRGFYFDSSITFGGSEESFNQSLKEQGWTLLYSEKLWIFHIIQLNLFSLIKKSFQQGKGSFKNLNQSGALKDMKQNWAFSYNNYSFPSFIYNLFFKLGYFWALSFNKRGSFIFRFFNFIFLLVKSRWYFITENLFIKLFGSVWRFLGWLYGRVLLYIFHHSPPMKIYYFSEYQYHKRIKPMLKKLKNK